MRSFKKMVKEKKIKILTLILLLVAFNSIYVVKGNNLPQLIHVNRNGTNGLEGMCVAKEGDAYSAIDWTFPIPRKVDQLPLITRYFLPEENINLNCNFERDEPCDEYWKLDGWSLPEDTGRNFEKIFDYRWEDFKTHLITNETKLVDSRVELPIDFNVTLSIRSDEGVEVLLCDGWLPEKYPCYTILFGGKNNNQIILRKDNVKNDLKIYESETSAILSFDRWSSFTISLTEYHDIIVEDATNNVELLKYKDKLPLTPILLFMKSEGASLWKIHKNRFLYTNKSISTKFGPNIKVPGTEICVSMYLTMCKSCEIEFYTVNDDQEEILLHLNHTDLANDDIWSPIKIIKHNYTKEHFQLYARTTASSGEPHWSVDSVRFCNEREIKIVTLINGETGKIDVEAPEVSCHALRMQRWRPKPYKIEPDTKLPMISAVENLNSIKLTWKQPTAYYPLTLLPYLIKYEGHHLCPSNYTLNNVSLHRLKSNGWLIATENAVKIENLIPYTHYTVVFADIIYGHVKNMSLNTLETDNVTENELPKNIRIKPTATSVKLFFDEPSCNDLYGRIHYKYTIDNYVNYSVRTSGANTWDGLEPFTNHTLTVEVARDLKRFDSAELKAVYRYNFTTKPSIASPVSNAEIYETDNNLVSIRYNLSTNLKGIPQYVGVNCCTPLRIECRFVTANITECASWDGSYCVTLNDLLRNQRYEFRVSIKNRNTSNFGEEIALKAVTRPRVPGKLTNVAYNVINCSDINDYCNLNISWDHPYRQDGVITAFEIVLVEITEDTNNRYDEIMLIDDRKYQKRYSYVIKYLPYTTTYTIMARAVNDDLKGEYVIIQGEIDHIAKHLDQEPKVVEETPYTLVVRVPELDVRLSGGFIVVVVQDDDDGTVDQDFIQVAEDNLCYRNKSTWIAKVIEMSKETPRLITIGDDTTEYSTRFNRTITNKQLTPGKEYCVNYVIQNSHRKKNHTTIYHFKHVHADDLKTNEVSDATVKIVVSVLFLIVVAITVGIILYRRKQKQLCCKNTINRQGEHIYEAMPFDDYNELPNVAYNAVYDKLNHE